MIGNLTGFGFPTTFVMDRQGVIRKVWIGYDDRHPEQIEEVDQSIARLLEEKAN
jgi:peroxiredoxin